MGDRDPSERAKFGSQTGLAFWSRPADTKTPHLHVDDWNSKDGSGEFGYLIGFSSHEDVSLLYKTAYDMIDSGKIGQTYYEVVNGTVAVNKLVSDVGSMGRFVRISHVSSCAEPTVSPPITPQVNQLKEVKKKKDAKKKKEGKKGLL